MTGNHHPEGRIRVVNDQVVRSDQRLPNATANLYLIFYSLPFTVITVRFVRKSKIDSILCLWRFLWFFETFSFEIIPL